MQNVHVMGETNIPNICSPLIENIEPDEDCVKTKQNNKQIESMHLGRVRKKSSNKPSAAIGMSNGGSHSNTLNSVNNSNGMSNAVGGATGTHANRSNMHHIAYS
jgi:hypothetical protein